VSVSPVGAFGDSFRSFFDAVDAYVANLVAISWTLLAIALVLHFGYLTVRTRAWFNALRAAYPAERFRWRNIWAAQVVGTGINSVIPARAGEVAKLYLAKQSVPNSTYPAVGSSFLVEAIFDCVLGALLIAFALTQGVFPDLPDLPSLPAFDLAFLAQHPRFTLFLVTFLAVAALALIAVLSVRVKAFWARVRQGLTILRDRRRYLREVVALQLVGWFLRLAGFWLLLEAFDIGGSLNAALLVMAVQSLSTLVPFTPGGAGAQQALLAVVFAGVATGPQVAAYSVGQQIAIAAFNAALGFAALAFVFRTTDWRSIVRQGRADRAREEETAAAAEPV
jgi:uncharacterized membrane protein YbhN (UPF0104 family)